MPSHIALRQSIHVSIVPSRERDIGTSARVCVVRNHRFDGVQ